MSDYITGEPMIPPNEREITNIINPTDPINHLRQQYHKMDNAELEALIREAEAELVRRKNERANKLIDKACDILNELQSIGVVFFFQEEDEYGDPNAVYVFDGERTFTPENFYMR